MEGAGAEPVVEGELEVSGAAWVARFPTSHSTADLTEDFGADVDLFLAALDAAGANVSISGTLRPLERAHLMHYSYRVARENLDPASVPAYEGVAIDWVHRTADGSVDRVASRQAAEAMVQAYHIVHRPSITSLHTEGRAIDMTITWSSTLRIVDASGAEVVIQGGGNGGSSTALHQVGATYGVRKLVGDAPHWSDNGR